ncbi:MAG: hypothetical protein COA50_07330 [Flavobacteriaceae bacterium]|nr:MAG: hypothetical protein COA50_07330 [Flavobacteriaceae bacterium]
MESKKYLDDISHIKDMMSRSSRFISLSGLSGILAGIYALIGAWFAEKAMKSIAINGSRSYDYFSDANSIEFGNDIIFEFFLIAILVILAAMSTGVILSVRKAKRKNVKLWDTSSKYLVVNFFIPLLTGGLFCLVLLQYNLAGLVAPATLIFYGLACVNASKYTFGDVRYLGLANIIIGLVATQFIGYGLYFWALGFGVFHILYGSLMYSKYDRK